MEKVDDALETDDQEGAEVAEVEEAKVALEAGQVEQARALLQDSIADAIAMKPLATGYGSGMGLVPDKLDGRGPLVGADWLVLGLSVAVSGLGVWLSIRYRPHESMSALRMLLGTTPDDKRRTP
jgi:lysozyme family protein